MMFYLCNMCPANRISLVLCRFFIITIYVQDLLSKNYDMLPVGNKIWKSSDGESWLITIDQIKPTIELIPFNTYCCDVDFPKKTATSPNRFFEALIRNIDEEKTSQKP